MSMNVEKQLNAIANGSFQGANALLGADSDSVGYVTEEGRQSMSEDTVKKMDEAYELVKGTIVPAANFNGIEPEDFPGLK